MDISIVAQFKRILGDRTKIFVNLTEPVVRPLIDLALKDIRQEYIEEGVLDRLNKVHNIPQSDLDEYYSGILLIIKTCLRKRVDAKELLELHDYLVKELKSPADGWARILVKTIEKLLSSEYKKNSKLVSTSFYPRLEFCKWEINITISSSILNRVMEPHIIMKWIFNTGQYCEFEISLLKFHQLRHAVAKILLNMQSIKQKTQLEIMSSN